MKTEQEIAIQLTKEAGEAIMAIYDETERGIREKADESPVTDADLAADKIIYDGLAKAFPDDGILTEESEDGKARLEKKRVWIVDPLDGTKEFIKRNGEFTINIALTIEGKPVLGIISAPVIDELYVGIVGDGAWLETNDERTAIHPSDTNKPADMILAISRSHSSAQEETFIKDNNMSGVLRKGSSLKGCMVAAGKADTYVRFGNIKEWDICAMNAIVAAAGAEMTKIDGTLIKYNQVEPFVPGGFLLSNGKAHEELLASAQACNNKEE